MTGDMFHLSVPPPILKRNFWLYVWTVGLPIGDDVHYVGMTGDTGSARAQSAANRVAAHLGSNEKNNALRKYVRERRQTDLADCRSLDFFTFGPMYDVPSDTDAYQIARGKVSALEKRLWERMEASGYKMLNEKPSGKASVDENRWNDVCEAFQRQFTNLK